MSTLYYMISTKIYSLLLFFCLLQACNPPEKSNSETTEYSPKPTKMIPFSTFRIGFYNTENLFDTIDDPHVNDSDFLPDGSLKWDSDRYELKMRHTAQVIDSINMHQNVMLFGLSEVENESVVKDLSQRIQGTWAYVHGPTSDPRGIDQALLYQPDYFQPISSTMLKFNQEEEVDYFVREVLYVKGITYRDTVHVLVLHWPSRRDGKEKTQLKRVAAAMLTREIVDSILQQDKKAQIVLMGDLNDEPTDESVQTMLSDKSILNPFIDLKQKGIGTCRHEGQWFLFDQILFSSNTLMGKKWKLNNAQVFNPDWLYYKENRKSGPFRTYMGKKYFGGYSDHFPVFVEFKK